MPLCKRSEAYVPKRSVSEHIHCPQARPHSKNRNQLGLGFEILHSKTLNPRR